MVIGERIKELREAMGLTQKQLAEELGITDAAVGFYEMNRRNPSLDILKKLADFFGVSSDYLLGRTDVENLYKDQDAITQMKKELNKYFTLDELEEFIHQKRNEL